MNELELWMNPNLSIEERFEIARGEIARLKGVIAKLCADTPPHAPPVRSIGVGSRITIGPRTPDVIDRSFTYDTVVLSLYSSGESVEVESTWVDSNGEEVYNIRVGNWLCGIYRDWVKSVE